MWLKNNIYYDLALYIYIYIEREREREVQVTLGITLSNVTPPNNLLFN